MGLESLQAAITRARIAGGLLRDSPARPHVFPVAPEFTTGARSSRRGAPPARCLTSRTT